VSSNENNVRQGKKKKLLGVPFPGELKWKQFKTRAKKRLIPIENVNRMLHDLLSRLSYKML
jgi:ribosomal protein S10